MKKRPSAHCVYENGGRGEITNIGNPTASPPELRDPDLQRLWSIGYMDKIGAIDSEPGIRPKKRERCSHVNYSRGGGGIVES